MKTIILAITTALWLTACDSVDGMREMLDAEEQLRGMIEEEIGVLPLVAFTSSKGIVIDVSFAFSAHEVADRSVSELVHAARKAVAGSFDNEPQAIYLQLVTKPASEL